MKVRRSKEEDKYDSCAALAELRQRKTEREKSLQYRVEEGRRKMTLFSPLTGERAVRLNRRFANLFEQGMTLFLTDDKAVTNGETYL